MPDLQPLYTLDNCQFAGPLQWGLSVFWRDAPCDDQWLCDLTTATESDGIRLLSHRFATPGVSQFFLSTRPEVSPRLVVQRVKGRLQHLVRRDYPKALKGNYSIRSIGTVTRSVTEDYVADQLGHHKMADPEVNQRLLRYQIDCPEVDLSQAQSTSHGIHWYNLHLVIVHRERWMEVRDAVLSRVREMVLKVCGKKRFRLSRAGILPDHLHLVLGCPFEMSPAEVSLAFLNNLAYAHGMTPIYQYGSYVRTVGEYTQNAIGE